MILILKDMYVVSQSCNFVAPRQGAHAIAEDGSDRSSRRCRWLTFLRRSSGRRATLASPTFRHLQPFCRCSRTQIRTRRNMTQLRTGFLLHPSVRDDQPPFLPGDHDIGSNSCPSNANSFGEEMPRGEDTVRRGGVERFLMVGLIWPASVSTSKECECAGEVVEVVVLDATEMVRRSRMILESTSTLFMRRMLR